MYDTSLEDLKNLRISVGNAVNATATLASRQEDPIQYFTENLNTVVGVVVDAQAFWLSKLGLGGTEVPQQQPPVNNVVQLPTQPQYQPAQQPVTYQPAAAAITQSAPAPIPGHTGSEEEANWQGFFAAVNNGQLAREFSSARQGQWFDNRVGKSPTAPDFKVKTPKGQNGPALWVGGKGNPSWVAQALRQAGLA